MTSINSETADRVAAAIARKDRSINYVAEHARVPRTTLTRKVNGIGSFTLDELSRIADLLGGLLKV